MDMFQDSLQNLNLQQSLKIHDEATNAPSSPPPASSASSDSLFLIQQSLYAAFQHTASCITQLYKQKHEALSREHDSESWQAFQRAAAAATVLYREACDSVRKAQEIVKLCESAPPGKSQSTLGGLQQTKRTRRNGASSKRHASTSPMNVSGSVSTLEYDSVFGSGSTASNNNANVSPSSDAGEEDPAPVLLRSGAGAVLELDIGTSSTGHAAFGRTEACAGVVLARKRLHACELFASDSVSDGSLPAPRVGDAPPLPADFERASVEFFREQKRARL